MRAIEKVCEKFYEIIIKIILIQTKICLENYRKYKNLTLLVGLSDSEKLPRKKRLRSVVAVLTIIFWCLLWVPGEKEKEEVRRRGHRRIITKHFMEGNLLGAEELERKKDL